MSWQEARPPIRHRRIRIRQANRYGGLQAERLLTVTLYSGIPKPVNGNTLPHEGVTARTTLRYATPESGEGCWIGPTSVQPTWQVDWGSKQQTGSDQPTHQQGDDAALTALWRERQFPAMWRGDCSPKYPGFATVRDA